MAQALAEKLEHNGPAEKKKNDLSSSEKAVGKYIRAAFAKLKRNKVVSSNQKIMRWERVQVNKTRTLAREKEKGGSEREQVEERVDFTVKENKLQKEKEVHAKTIPPEKVGESISE